LSNKWSFYTPAELRALEWTDQHSVGTTTWVGFDERLREAFVLADGDTHNDNQWDVYTPKPETRAFIVSDVVRLQGSRLGQPLPALNGELRIYDNGTTQLYRLRPRTPFQD